MSIAHRPPPVVRHPPSAVRRPPLPPSVHRPLLPSAVYRPLPAAHCPASAVHCPLSIARSWGSMGGWGGWDAGRLSAAAYSSALMVGQGTIPSFGGGGGGREQEREQEALCAHPTPGIETIAPHAFGVPHWHPRCRQQRRVDDVRLHQPPHNTERYPSLHCPHLACAVTAPLSLRHCLACAIVALAPLPPPYISIVAIVVAVTLNLSLIFVVLVVAAIVIAILSGLLCWWPCDIFVAICRHHHCCHHSRSLCLRSLSCHHLCLAALPLFVPLAGVVAASF